MSLFGDVRSCQNSFTSGILSPAVAARTDLQRYDSGASDILNFLILKSGGLENRSGSHWVFTLPEEEEVRLVPFEYSDTDSLLMLFRPGKIQFLRRGETSYSLLYKGNTPYEVATTYTADVIRQLKITQSYDTIYLAHPREFPKMLVRYGETDFRLEKFKTADKLPPPSNLKATAESLSGTGMNLSYVVVALDKSAFEGEISNRTALSVPSIWPSGGKVKLSWDKMPKAWKYAVYKQIESGNMGYIGETYSPNFTDNNIRPDETRSPFRTPLSILDRTIVSESGSGITVQYDQSIVYINPDTWHDGRESMRPKADCTQFQTNPSFPKTFIAKFSEKVRLNSITIYPSSANGLAAWSGARKAVRLVLSNGLNGFGQNLFEQIIEVSEQKQSITLEISSKPVMSEFYLHLGAKSGSANFFLSQIKFNTTAVADPSTGEAIDVFGFNYPSDITLFNQRLVLGGSAEDPMTLFASRTGMLYDFTTGTPLRDDDAFEADIAALRGAKIEHVLSLNNLIILTGSGEFILRGSGGQTLSPTTLECIASSHYGAAAVPPVFAGKEALFVTARGNIIRTFGVENETGGYSTYNGAELTLLSDHLFKDQTVTTMAWQSDEDRLWVTLSRGTLLSLTYDRDQEIWGWSRHDFDAFSESVAVLKEGVVSRVFIVFRKSRIEKVPLFNEDGTPMYGDDGKRIYENQSFDTRTIEMLSDRKEGCFVDHSETFKASKVLQLPDNANTAALRHKEVVITSYNGKVHSFCDSNLKVSIPEGYDFVHTWTNPDDPSEVKTYAYLVVKQVNSMIYEFETEDGRPFVLPRTRTLSNSFLFGKAVMILDGLAYWKVTADPSGKIMIPDEVPAAEVTVGLPYVSRLDSLPAEVRGMETLQGVRRSLSGVSLLFENSLGGHLGTEAGNMIQIDLKIQKRLSDIFPETVEKYYPLPGSWGGRGTYRLEQRDPFPMTLLRAIPEIKAGK